MSRDSWTGGPANERPRPTRLIPIIMPFRSATCLNYPSDSGYGLGIIFVISIKAIRTLKTCVVPTILRLQKVNGSRFLKIGALCFFHWLCILIGVARGYSRITLAFQDRLGRIRVCNLYPLGNLIWAGASSNFFISGFPTLMEDLMSTLTIIYGY